MFLLLPTMAGYTPRKCFSFLIRGKQLAGGPKKWKAEVCAWMLLTVASIATSLPKMLKPIYSPLEVFSTGKCLV